MEDKATPEEIPKPAIEDVTKRPTPHPLVASLPPHLKDPANYYKIQKEILESFASTCSHSEIMEWANCPKCTRKMLDRRLLLRKLGFKNAAQYMVWQKIHEEIKTRYPVMDWKTRQQL